jgi:copper chaperone CopZ
VPQVEFVVENAGCSSCADRVRGALEPIATVASVAIDESADVAGVRLETSGGLTQEAVNEALRAASAGSGHEYRVRADSWHTLSS